MPIGKLCNLLRNLKEKSQKTQKSYEEFIECFFDKRKEVNLRDNI